MMIILMFPNFPPPPTPITDNALDRRYYFCLMLHWIIHKHTLKSMVSNLLYLSAQLRLQQLLTIIVSMKCELPGLLKS